MKHQHSYINSNESFSKDFFQIHSSCIYFFLIIKITNLNNELLHIKEYSSYGQYYVNISTNHESSF